MLHRNAAQKRLGIKPSALQAFQQPPQAQTAANGGMNPQPKQNQPGAPTATAGAAGISSTRCTSLIPDGSPSPSPLSPTTHHAAPALQQAAPTTIGKAQPECRAQQAPPHRIKKGNEQAGSSRLQPRGGSTPAAATPAAARGTLQPASAISLTEPGTPRMHRLARDLPFGAGHGQAELAMDPLPAPPFPLTPAGEVIQPPPPALPPEAWPCECNTNKAKHPKRDKVFLNTTHC